MGVVQDQQKVGIGREDDNFGDKVGPYDIRKGVDMEIDLQTGIGADKSAEVFGHEAFVHAEPDQLSLESIKQSLNDGTIKPGSQQYVQRLEAIAGNGSAQHQLLLHDKVSHLINYINQLNVLHKTTNFNSLYQVDKKDTRDHENGQ